MVLTGVPIDLGVCNPARFPTGYLELYTVTVFKELNICPQWLDIVKLMNGPHESDACESNQSGHGRLGNTDVSVN